MSRQISTADRAPRKRNQPSPRTREQVLAELRGLGGLVLEQALLDATTRPLKSLLDWTERLALELGEPRPGRAGNYPELLRVIVAISRRAGSPEGLKVA